MRSDLDQPPPRRSHYPADPRAGLLMPAARAILGPNGKPYRLARAGSRTRYHAADTSPEGGRFWLNADGLSAREANSPEVRRLLRNRARFECDENNSYAWGIVQTLANDVVGTGPQLQVQTKDKENNKAIERAFGEWCDAVQWAEKLRLLRRERAVLGEGFALLRTNPKLPTDVKLDFQTIEADQIATPDIDPTRPDAVDGIRFDRWGNPTQYDLLDSHPGDGLGFSTFGSESTAVPADLMLHWFLRVRSGQRRGIPDVTTSLPLFSQLRRFTLAVMAAADTAADFSAVLESDAPAGEEVIQGVEFEELEIARRLLMTLPAGQKLHQFEATQPTTTYQMFKHEILNEIARCVNMPFNVAAGNSSSYNYASGRLDHQTYFKAIKVDQGSIRTIVLEPIFRAWLAEAKLATKLIPGSAAPFNWPHRWIWPGTEHVDPEKEANAQETRLRNGMTSFGEECWRDGVDPDARLDNMAEAVAEFKRRGLPAPAYMSPPAQPSPSNGQPQRNGQRQPVGGDDGQAD
jgi:lambda family phage portal protein